jgi:hypothetical protein
MQIIVFLGPTLSVRDARLILDAEYMPPARAGDIYNALSLDPHALVLIDGLFDQVPSVWHKEILFALANGFPVFGASSMGALRAAELHAFGMRGFGNVFQAYRDGVLDDDDEVAVTHGSAAERYVPLSEAMVNIRHGLAQARKSLVISAGTEVVLSTAAKRRFYPDRSWNAVFSDGATLGVSASELVALREFVNREQPSIKRDDARGLLQWLATSIPLERNIPTFDFHATASWLDFSDRVKQVRAEPAQEDATTEDLVRHVAIASGNRAESLRRALFFELLMAEFERQNLTIDQRALDEAQKSLNAIRSNALEVDEWEQLGMVMAMTDQLVSAQLDQLMPFVRLALGLDGHLAQTLELVARKRRYLMDRGLSNPTLTDAGVDLATLLDWYERRCGLAAPSPESYAERLGLPSARSFLTELLGQFIFAKVEDSS